MSETFHEGCPCASCADACAEGGTEIPTRVCIGTLETENAKLRADLARVTGELAVARKAPAFVECEKRLMEFLEAQSQPGVRMASIAEWAESSYVRREMENFELRRDLDEALGLLREDLAGQETDKIDWNDWRMRARAFLARHPATPKAPPGPSARAKSDPTGAE
jgi:hypothetical protein